MYEGFLDIFDVFLEQAAEFYVWDNAIYLFRAMMTTLTMTIIGCGLGFIFGMIVVYFRRTPGLIFWPVRMTVIFYVETFRRVPFLVLLFLVMFTVKGFGLDFSLFTIACISIVIISTAFIGEIIRAGLDSVHQTQWDTADAMNFSRLQTLRHVILPQAWKVVLPPAFAFFVMFIKDTALTSQVGVLELTQAGKYYNNLGYSAILSFGTVLVLYFVLSYPMTRLGWWMEARLHTRRRDEQAEFEVGATAYELRGT
jgi:polar amino acid transport system permease protein